MKGATQSIDSRMGEAEERIFEVEGRDFEIVPSRRTKTEEQKKSEESPLTCGMPSKEAICELSVFQKEKTGRGRKKVYLKK